MWVILHSLYLYSNSHHDFHFHVYTFIATETKQTLETLIFTSVVTCSWRRELLLLTLRLGSDKLLWVRLGWDNNKLMQDDGLTKKKSGKNRQNWRKIGFDKKNCQFLVLIVRIFEMTTILLSLKLSTHCFTGQYYCQKVGVFLSIS